MTLFQAERSASTSLESGSSRWCGTVIVTRLAAWPLASQVAKPGCSNPSPAPSRTSPDFRARARRPRWGHMAFRLADRLAPRPSEAYRARGPWPRARYLSARGEQEAMSRYLTTGAARALTIVIHSPLPSVQNSVARTTAAEPKVRDSQGAVGALRSSARSTAAPATAVSASCASSSTIRR